MIVLLSPSKSLDYETPAPTSEHTEPAMLEDSRHLIALLRDYDVAGLKSLMGISDKLAELNRDRYREFETPFTPSNAKQALYAFTGDVYTDFRLDQYSEEDVAFAQAHVRILSGLYGLLRPLDLIQPYRLEMGTRLENPRGKNLYEFWGEKISKAIAADLNEQGDEVVVNLASNEYFGSVNKKVLDARVITPVFRDFKNGKYKIISFYAKRARGTMTDFIISHRITEPEGLKAFTGGGYYFSDDQSKGDEFVFLRDRI